MSVTKSTTVALLVIVFCALTLSSCATNHAPSGWLPDRKTISQEKYGGWLYLKWRGRLGEEEITQGEFIGIYDTTCFIFDHTILIRVPIDHISLASLKIHEDDRGSLAVWTLLGTLSTISNGFYLLITAPLWIIAGTIITSTESNSGLFTEEYPDIGWWRTVTRYSRFPQGIPKEVDLSKLKSKLVFSE
jgi:hypothetical protein